jgi:hypothetical protein
MEQWRLNLDTTERRAASITADATLAMAVHMGEKTMLALSVDCFLVVLWWRSA